MDWYRILEDEELLYICSITFCRDPAVREMEGRSLARAFGRRDTVLYLGEML